VGKATIKGLKYFDAAHGLPLTDRTDMPNPDRIVIAGVGNLLLTDDGIGVHVIRELRRRPLSGITYLDAGMAILHSLTFLEWAQRVLIIDAAMGKKAPGTIYLIDRIDKPDDAPVKPLQASNLISAFRLLCPGKTPPPITVLGVQPDSLAYGTELSPKLKAVLPQIEALTQIIAGEWLKEPEPFFLHSEKCDCLSTV
jgi:hydrogenase maturation protease